MAKYNPFVIDTLGLEIEGTILTRDDVMRVLKDFGPFSPEGTAGESSPIQRIHRDASVESSIAVSRNGMKFFLGSNLMKSLPTVRGYCEGVVSGFELITKPLLMEELVPFLKSALPRLACEGEIFSPRASIHIHTGFPSIFSALKNAVTLGLKVEGLLYRIAGLGNEFRGSINHSIYCKPLAIPPVVPLGERQYGKLSPQKAQFAENQDQFWGYYAIAPGQATRYHPARYFGVNIFSTRLIDTLEFRHFNLSLNPGYIVAVSALCQVIAELSLLGNQEDFLKMRGVDITERTPVGDYERVLIDLSEFARKYGAESSFGSPSIDSLMQIIENTPEPLFRQENVLTHTNYAARHMQFELDLVEARDVIPSGHVDIHNFGNEERSIL
jgi:hypothetical protein